MQQFTYCRLCEAGCGLTADVEHNKILEIAPDPQHPLSQGFVCHKGLALGRLQDYPERLTEPQRNVGSRRQPAFEACSWEQALGDMATRLRGLRQQYGPQAIGLYMGNPSAFSFATSTYAVAFMRALGSPRVYSAVSIDCAERFYVAQRMLGHELLVSIPDLEQTHFAILIGGNPLVSQWCQLGTLPRWQRMLRERRKQGARFVVVDPRRTETAAIADQHLQLRPNSDCYLLFAMLHHLLADELYDAAYTERYCQGLEVVFDAVQRYTPEYAAMHTGVSAATIRELAERFAAAPSGFIVGHSGVTMTRHGSLAEWAILTLNAITGNLDRPGGLYFNQGVIDPVRLSALAAGERLSHSSEGFARVLDSEPCCRLVDAIESDGAERLRALIIIAGNPLRSFPQPRKLQAAFERLELLVSIDLRPNESAAGADYLLPATTMLERDDITLLNSGLLHRPFVQYTSPVLKAPPGVREEWQILRDLTRRGAVPIWRLERGFWSRLPWRFMMSLHPRWVLRFLLALWGRAGLSTIQRQPHGLLLGEREFGWLLARPSHAAQRRVLLDVPELIQACRELRDADASDSGEYPWRLISRRDRDRMNTWFSCASVQAENPPAEVNDDAASGLGFHDGERVRVQSRVGCLTVRLHLTPDVPAGVIVLPQGCRFAEQEEAGGCMNDLIDDRQVEPFTGLPQFNGTAVRLEALC